jgi:hypothetical protein
MDFYSQGALAAQHFYKVADVLLANPIGRRVLRYTWQAINDPEGKTRVVRTLEPYYDEYVEGDENAFDNFDARLRARWM